MPVETKTMFGNPASTIFVLYNLVLPEFFKITRPEMWQILYYATVSKVCRKT